MMQVHIAIILTGSHLQTVVKSIMFGDRFHAQSYVEKVNLLHFHFNRQANVERLIVKHKKWHHNVCYSVTALLRMCFGYNATQRLPCLMGMCAF